jgi:hypothetical protein
MRRIYNMNKHIFLSRAKRTSLAVGKCLLVASAAVAAVSAQSAPETDLSLQFAILGTTSADAPGTIKFFTTVVVAGEENQARATGTVLRVVLPEGAVPTGYVVYDRNLGGVNAESQCRFADGVVTCDLGEVIAGILGKSKTLLMYVKPARSGFFAVTGQVTANKVDPNMENNTQTFSVGTPKTRKRVRLF